MGDQVVVWEETKCELSQPQGPLKFEMSQAEVDRLVEQLERADLLSQPRFVTLTKTVKFAKAGQGDQGRFESRVSYVNLFGHLQGVLVEVLHTRPEGLQSPVASVVAPVAPIAYCPAPDAAGERMARIWVGQHYRRVPLEFLVTKLQAIEIVKHFLTTQGQLLPGLQWAEETSLEWQMRISPDDDYFNPDEPATRPSSQLPSSLSDVLESLRRSYTELGIDVNLLR